MLQVFNKIIINNNNDENNFGGQVIFQLILLRLQMSLQKFLGLKEKIKNLNRKIKVKSSSC